MTVKQIGRFLDKADRKGIPAIARWNGDAFVDHVYELFRVFDNFNVPLGAAESGGETKLQGMRTSTIWTCGCDLENKTLYWHTQNNRQVQKVDVSRIDFEKLTELQVFPLDVCKEQAIIDRTPSK